MTKAFNHAATACILGDMDLIRPLALAGIPCVAVTTAGSVTSHSRLVAGIVTADTGDIAATPADLPERLLKFAAAKSEKPVLFYQEDEQLLFVSRQRERLARGFRFAIPDAGLVEDLVDKARFHRLAARLGLPVPATRHIRPAEDAVPDDLGLAFPIIVKPLRRTQAWTESGHAAKAEEIAGPAELHEKWPRWATRGLELLAQELVPGPESAIESYHVYAGADGGIVGEFTGRKIRTLPPELGHSTALTITDAADVAALGRDLVRALGLRGVAKFDFKRAPDGRLFLLEVNPRFNLWHHLGAVAGVNLPALVYAGLTGRPLPAAMPMARAGATWCRLTQDWRAARASGMTLPAWAAWAMHCDALPISLSDPVPALLTLGRVLSERLPLHRNAQHPASKSAVAAGN